MTINMNQDILDYMFKYLEINEMMLCSLIISKKFSTKYYKDITISHIKNKFENINPLIDIEYLDCLKYLQSELGIIRIENGIIHDNGFSNFLNNLYNNIDGCEQNGYARYYYYCFENILYNLIKKPIFCYKDLKCISMISKFLKRLKKFYNASNKEVREVIIENLSHRKNIILKYSIFSHTFTFVNGNIIQNVKSLKENNEYLLSVDYICDNNMVLYTYEQNKIRSLLLDLLATIRKKGCSTLNEHYQQDIIIAILYNINKNNKVSDFIDYFVNNMNKYISKNYNSELFFLIYIYLFKIETKNNNIKNINKLLNSCSQMHLRRLYFNYDYCHDDNKSLNYLEKALIDFYFPKNFVPNKKTNVILKQTKSNDFLKEIKKRFKFDHKKYYSDIHYLGQKMKAYYILEKIE